MAAECKISPSLALRRSALDADRLVLGLGGDAGHVLPAATGAPIDTAAIGAMTDEERRDRMAQLVAEAQRRLADDGAPSWPATLGPISAPR
ncbi:MAG: hypothetical protein M3P96_15490 [Actinomycetota bacterium]|nr:hypothetical protein [Actinomycetota bacterium]